MEGILGDLDQLRWQDGVDVFLLTLVLYRLYIWLRGTVAIQIVVGMLTLVAASAAARLLGFVLTAYVLQGIGAVAVLVGVVIFRDEIRRALTRASPMRLWLRKRTTQDRRDFTPVAEALFALGRRRLGALVVIARRDNLSEHVTGGVRVGAHVSEPLLEALFQKASPLHDGAAIIDGDRITTAAAFLPLARTELPVRFGTRHSAAVGLSEVCDALVIAVSEERGEVSVAAGGELFPMADASALGRRLGELAGPSIPQDPRPRGTPLKDAAVAAFIFVGVVAAWNVVANRADAIEERAVPVELHGAPTGVRLEALPSEVMLRLRGPRRLLVNVETTDLHAWSDASAAVRGAADVPVSGTAPPGIQVVGVQPIRVGVLELRTLPVEAELSEKAVRAARVEPAIVTLVGKVGAFKGMKSVKTLPIVASSGVVTTRLAIPAGMRLEDGAQADVEVELAPRSAP